MESKREEESTAMQPIDQSDTVQHAGAEGKEMSTTQQIKSRASTSEPIFSIFTKGQKVLIIVFASLAALFSPLSANIYYPAIGVLASDLNVTYTAMNLTITAYLIFQGFAPSFTGSFSDECGRRPAYIVCFVLYVGANIGLALQDNYAALLVLRCLQSCGSSGTVALANAVVADVAVSSQRGSYIGYVSMGALIGPAVGPIIGGVLCEFLGWRAVFWFLSIISAVLLIGIAIFLPETCRKIVGNGSLPPQKWNYSLISYLALRKTRRDGLVDEISTQSYKSRPNPLHTLYIILDLESGLVLLYAGLLFTGFYMVLTGMPSQFADTYGFNTLQIGLCYIPAGCGSLFAAIISGRFLDRNFRRHADKIGMEISKTKQQDLSNFPIEAARLEVVFPMVIMACVFIVAFGWTMEARTSLAAPLIFLFCSTFCISGTFQGMSTLVVDMNRSTPGTATAAMNLVRCWLGAGGVAAVVPLLNKIGSGWVSVLISGILLLTSPIILVVMKRGPTWRKEKLAREDKKRKAKEAAQVLNADLEEGRKE